MCEHFSISPSNLSKLFKRETGLGVLEYIHTTRTEDAKKLLEGDMSIDDIFPRCGFYSRRAFDAVFKRYVGVSPSVYRSSVVKSMDY